VNHTLAYYTLGISIHFLGGGGGNLEWVTEFLSNQKGWVTIFFLEPNKEGLIYINDSWGGPCLFSKLTKGGPGDLKYICLWGFLCPSPLPPKNEFSLTKLFCPHFPLCITLYYTLALFCK